MKAFLLATLVACGGSRGPATHHIEIRAMQFEPALVDVAVGDTVVWTNRDIVPHTVTAAEHAAARFDSASIAAGAQWQYTVTAPGELGYICTFHPTMFGTLSAR